VLRSAAADQRLMMSSEQWLDDLRELAGDLPSRRRFRSWLRRLGMPVDVVCYIRPQLGWFTSAYLEWGLWAGLTPEEYCSDPHLLDYSNWSRTAELVRSLGFRKVLFRYRPDAVGDFFELCQLDMPAEAPLLERVFANGRSSEMLIKFLLRHPHLRPLHDSRVQLVASRLAPSSASGGQDAVSVLGAELADRLHAEFVDSNADLAGVLEAPQFADFCEAFEREREQHASPRAWLTTDEADEGMYTEFLERLLSACLEFLVDNPPKPGYSRIT
jgi:hypothetical protein